MQPGSIYRVYFRQPCLLQVIFVHIQFDFVTLFSKITGYKFFKPSMTFCCYGNKNLLATRLVRQIIVRVCVH